MRSGTAYKWHPSQPECRNNCSDLNTRLLSVKTLIGSTPQVNDMRLSNSLAIIFMVIASLLLSYTTACTCNKVRHIVRFLLIYADSGEGLWQRRVLPSLWRVQ